MEQKSLAIAPPPPHDMDLEARLAKKVLAMEADCGYVQKDKKNPQQNYKYASAEAVLKKVSAAAVEHGVASYPRYEILSDEVVEVGQNKTRMRLVTARCVLHLVDSETGYGRDAEGLGSGSDTLDKASMKAQTASHKYAWMGLLNISTGDDPEADEIVLTGQRGAAIPVTPKEDLAPNSPSDMTEALPDAAVYSPAVSLKSFEALGISRKQVEDLLQRDLGPGATIPEAERQLMRKAHADLTAKRATWPQIVAERAKVLAETYA